MRDMDGKKIKEIWWPDTELEQGRHVPASDQLSLEISATYCGDHNEIWIVEKNLITGEEVARHNPRYVETIIWA